MADINKVYASKHLNAFDLNGETHVVTITREEMVKFPDDEDEKPIIYFEGWEKGLVVNKTNAKTIAGLYGQHTEGWVGKQVELYSTIVDFRGQPTPAIRVRSPRKAARAQLAHQESKIDLHAPLDDEIPF